VQNLGSKQAEVQQAGYVRKFQRRRLILFGIAFQFRLIGMVCWVLWVFLFGWGFFFAVGKMEDVGLWGKNMNWEWDFWTGMWM